MQYAPYRLAEGDWDKKRTESLGDLAVEMLSPHLQGAAIVQRTALSPLDLEESAGWPEGQAHHAEPTLDQMLWMRPLPSLARYRTPIEGLWLCGPAMHPGAAAPGAAGASAAREMLRNDKP